MKLIQIAVENFGVLHDLKIDCREGLNVFCRDNGAGKTTLAAFLCAMLYGLPATRKNDPAENERKKYLPWQGGSFGGSITFSVRGKTYRAERTFAEGNSARHDTFVLYDLADNTVSDDYSDALGMELFGLDAAAFERSAYLPQKLLSGERTNESITAKLNRAIGGDTAVGDDSGQYRAAAAVLDRQRQYYAKQGGRGYLGVLEQTLASLHEQEYQALQAKAEAERHDAEAEALAGALVQITEQKQALTAAQTAAGTRRAVLAHGRSLLERRDAQLSAAAEKRQFLHLDDTDGIAAGRYGTEVICQAEESHHACVRLHDKLDALEESIAQAGAEQNRIAQRFRDGIPDAEMQASLAAYVRILREGEGADTGAAQTLPACFSEEELSRHTGQALMHAQMTEVLAQPKTALAEYRAACADAGMEEGDPLPDDDTLQAYADVLGALARNRDVQAKLMPQKQEADAAYQTLEEECRGIPAQKEIVAMRSRFDALRGRTEEIEELEARQRLAVQVTENLRRSRRIRIGVGIGLLFIAAALVAAAVLRADMRFLIAGGSTALPGLLFFILGLFTSPEENDEARALEDAAQKRLCTKKSEYEVEKTVIYEFLDRIGGNADAVMDENDAAERFDAAASAAREREAAAERVRTLDEQLSVLYEEEARLSASLSSYTKSGGGEIADIGEDRAVFAEYRRKLRTCAAAYRSCTEEREVRAQAHAKQDALALALDRYLQSMTEACPAGLEKQGDTENGTYTERMAAWCRTADLLRLQIGEHDRRQAHRRAMEERLWGQLDGLFSGGAVLHGSPESGGVSVLACAEEALSLCARYQTLADEKAVYAEQRAVVHEQIDLYEAALTEFLAGYFAEPRPTPQEGLQIIRGREAALAEDMKYLRDAQRQLNAFLSERRMTEEELISAGQEGADPAEDDMKTAAAIAALDEEVRQKTELRAKALQNAEHASRLGAEAAVLRAQIANTEQTLADANRALSVIRKTQECLDAAKTALSTRYLAHMQARFRVYWSRLTGCTEEAAAGLSLDASLAPQTEVFGARRDVAYFSRGTQDCIDFCIRLALIDAMYTDGGTKTDAPLPPLLLDDPFVNLDQTHLTAARAMLDEIADRFQILYFVCHESRM
ncbi:MAG: hypothetical protein E7604_13845 [Ruminococcaceae bacterium]|nr:hypothetical protein [Oscillospiraceae bacterium]